MWIFGEKWWATLHSQYVRFSHILLTKVPREKILRGTYQSNAAKDFSPSAAKPRRSTPLV
jgi:hypothetical protein